MKKTRKRRQGGAGEERISNTQQVVEEGRRGEISKEEGEESEVSPSSEPVQTKSRQQQQRPRKRIRRRNKWLTRPREPQRMEARPDGA